MDKKRLKLLFEKYFAKSATEEERTEFFKAIQEDQYAEWLKMMLEDQYLQNEMEGQDSPLYDQEVLFQAIKDRLEIGDDRPRRQTMILKKVIPIAAMLLFVFSLTYFFRNDALVTVDDLQTEIRPGREAGYLTLGDGRKILLDSISQGLVAVDRGVSIERETDGELLYRSGVQKGAVAYHTLETSQGQFFRIVLPDGTRVWMNASSTLVYPSAFPGKDRKVELAGEAYFEVAHQEDRPFTVLVNGHEVVVLGTKFNVRGYDRDESQTTLVEGKVQVKGDGRKAVVLTPGQQALISKGIVNVTQVNTDDIIAWKNGYFMFDNQPLMNVLPEISRWYGVHIVYENEEAKQVALYGSISRHSDIRQVLKKIEMTKEVSFRLSGRTIYVNKP